VRFDPQDKPGVSNLLTIFSALAGKPVSELEDAYSGKGYGDLKKDLAEVVVDFVTPFRQRTLEILDDRAELGNLLAAGAQRARDVAAPTLAAAYRRMGFVPAT
jgi:tryptophanyl-tRNA synthetase